MAYLVSDLKNDLEAVSHNTLINKIQNINELVWRAARQVLLDVDPIETIRVSSLVNLFDNVFIYAAPADLKGDKVIDIRPQSTEKRTTVDNFHQTWLEEFDHRKDNNSFTIETRSATKFLRLSKAFTARSVIDNIEGLTANGSWAATGTGAALALDQVVYISGGGSLSFNVSGSGTAILTNSTLTQVDLSKHQNISSLFLWIYFPTAVNVTSVDLRWGSDASNYFSRTVTTAHPSNAFQDGWNLLRFDWAGTTETGSVTETAIDFVRIAVAHTATDTGYRIDSLTSNLPSPFEIVYYSKFPFRTTGGTYGETITADTNIINLDSDSQNLLMNQCGKLLAQQLQGSDGSFDFRFFDTEYREGVKKYNGTYRSQVIRPRITYYRM